jgi:hypothetical protein
MKKIFSCAHNSHKKPPEAVRTAQRMRRGREAFPIWVKSEREVGSALKSPLGAGWDFHHMVKVKGADVKKPAQGPAGFSLMRSCK